MAFWCQRRIVDGADVPELQVYCAGSLFSLVGGEESKNTGAAAQRRHGKGRHDTMTTCWCCQRHLCADFHVCLLLGQRKMVLLVFLGGGAKMHHLAPSHRTAYDRNDNDGADTTNGNSNGANLLFHHYPLPPCVLY
mmetsp:Transcript_31348/g.46799  ORF Transcript_31348/g.46799 Transcript_31348/m.46799 type:complete len:136 (-) Transcript_31348:15-422(-)